MGHYKRIRLVNESTFSQNVISLIFLSMVAHLRFLPPSSPHFPTRYIRDLRARALVEDRECDVVAIGAGIARLAAAKRLGESRRRVRVLGASDVVGGRIRGDKLEGFVLDRWFQVFVKGYPRASAM